MAVSPSPGLRKISRLSENTSSSLRSSVIITDMAAVVEELVYNAIDAQAGKVEVFVDMDNWECKVADDGIGFEAAELANVGNRYMSSKVVPVHLGSGSQQYGFRGEALASLAKTCLLNIVTRSHGDDARSVILQNGHIIYHGPAEHDIAGWSGTEVRVRDLFNNWPVRRKAKEASSTYKKAVIARIKTFLQHSAVFNYSVSFSVCGVSEENADPFALRMESRLFATSQCNCMRTAFGNIFGKEFVQLAQDISLESDACRLEGFISDASFLGKSYQLIYINGRFSSSSDIHRRINQIYLKSSFSQTADSTSRSDHQDLYRSPTKAVRYLQTPSHRKSLERYPVFCISITVPPDTVGFHSEGSKHVAHLAFNDNVLAAVTRVVKCYLTGRNLLEPEERLAPQASGGSPSTTIPDPKGSAVHIRDPPLQLYTRGSSGPTGQLQAITIVNQPQPDALADPHISLQRPAPSSATLQMNAEPTETTCQAEPWPPLPLRASKAKVDRTYLRRNDRQLSSGTYLNGSPPSEISLWYENAVSRWQNPVFSDQRSEGDIPVLGAVSSLSMNATQFGSVGAIPETYRLQVHKSDLSRGFFVGQVDRKYLAVRLRLQTECGEILLMVDQHAADERIRIERMQRKLVEQQSAEGVASASLSLPALFVLPRHEVEVLQNERGWFSSWGFNFEMGLHQPSNYDVQQVQLRTAPVAIVDRLQGDKPLIRDLVRKELCRLSQKIVDERPATNAFPEMLTDLLNSKACRGAIMFNDELEEARCERLFCDLARTQFPFVCAHGRPSLVPLVKLRNIEGHSEPRRRALHWHSFVNRCQRHTLPLDSMDFRDLRA